MPMDISQLAAAYRARMGGGRRSVINPQQNMSTHMGPISQVYRAQMGPTNAMPASPAAPTPVVNQAARQAGIYDPVSIQQARPANLPRQWDASAMPSYSDAIDKILAEQDARDTYGSPENPLLTHGIISIGNKKFDPAKGWVDSEGNPTTAPGASDLAPYKIQGHTPADQQRDATNTSVAAGNMPNKRQGRRRESDAFNMAGGGGL